MAVTDAVADYVRRCDGRVAAVLPEAARRVEALGARLAEAGLAPDDLVDVAALDRLPVLSKDELVDLQAADPPFGGLLAPGASLRRLFQSPGPLYEPEPDEPDPWRWVSALEAAGFGPGDVVLNACGYHLTPLGAMFEQALFALGATVVPAGVGSKDLQARACRDLRVTAYVGLPSYLKALLEQAEELGLSPETLERAFVIAEPLPPSLRTWLEERVPVVRQGYGTAEAGNLGFECDELEGLHVPDDALVQVCELATGAALWDGGEGQVVITLFRPDYPLVRLGTGDLSAFLTEPCRCGIPTPRIAGWLGRVGEAVKVRGMFLHPRQARAALAAVPGLERFRLLVDRSEHLDTLRCEVVPVAGADPAGLAAAVQERIRSGLRLNADAVVVSELAPDEPTIVDLRSWE
ncbi:MAG: AMP-binding protein [Actinobacteria bacterium]|nr:AMP-binding protein [Actinomycetota bacterium]